MVAVPTSSNTVTVRTVDTQIGASPRTEIGRLVMTWDSVSHLLRRYGILARTVRDVGRGAKNRLLLNSTATHVAERWDQGFNNISKEIFGTEPQPMMEPFV